MASFFSLCTASPAAFCNLSLLNLGEEWLAAFVSILMILMPCLRSHLPVGLYSGHSAAVALTSRPADHSELILCAVKEGPNFIFPAPFVEKGCFPLEHLGLPWSAQAAGTRPENLWPLELRTSRVLWPGLLPCAHCYTRRGGGRLSGLSHG